MSASFCSNHEMRAGACYQCGHSFSRLPVVKYGVAKLEDGQVADFVELRTDDIDDIARNYDVPSAFPDQKKVCPACNEGWGASI